MMDDIIIPPGAAMISFEVNNEIREGAEIPPNYYRSFELTGNRDITITYRMIDGTSITAHYSNPSEQQIQDIIAIYERTGYDR